MCGGSYLKAGTRPGSGGKGLPGSGGVEGDEYCSNNLAISAHLTRTFLRCTWTYLNLLVCSAHPARTFLQITRTPRTFSRCTWTSLHFIVCSAHPARTFLQFTPTPRTFSRVKREIRVHILEDFALVGARFSRESAISVDPGCYIYICDHRLILSTHAQGWTPRWHH